MEIRGEYWIIQGSAEYADGDNGDKNHEMIAIEHICSENLDKLYHYTKSLGLQSLGPSAAKVHYNSLVDDPVEGVAKLLAAIRSNIQNSSQPNPIQRWEDVIKQSGIDREAFLVMTDGGDARLYMMKRDGWIAVRNNNIELYGLDQNKLKSLSSGLDEVIDQEIGEEDVSDEDIEFNLYDVKNNKSIDVTLKDIKDNNVFRPQRLPQTKYNTILFAPPDKKGFLGSQSPKSLDARTRSLLSTSESDFSFKKWLIISG